MGKLRGVARCLAAALFAGAGAACAVEEGATAEGSMMTEAEVLDAGNSGRELIVLAAPGAGDPYYADVADDIRAFHMAFARAIAGRDDVLILADEEGARLYAEAVGAAHVATAPVDDIWARDFSLSNAAAPVMFRYTAAGQGGGRRGQSDADAVQEGLAAVIDAAGLSYAASDLLNDGGNFVDDYAGNVVVSRKFLRDNKLSEEAGRRALTKLAGVRRVAFIEADEQGGLEHADGVVAFIGPSEIVINRYDEDPDYAAALKDDLRRAIPDIVIHEIVTAYDGSQIYDDRFGSACGLYTNMLVTPSRIYLPQFGIPEDVVALEQMKAWTSKEIVPVRSDGVCRMGGGVRCMSWQLRGDNAQKLKAALKP